MNPQDFDPDEFVLTKKDVLDFIDIVINYWGRTVQDKLKNIKLIAGLEMMKAGVIFTNESDFKVIWSMLLKFIVTLQYENTRAKMDFPDVLKKLKTDLQTDGLEKMFMRYQKKK